MKKELTSPLETATRKLIDETLKNVGWKTDEFGKDCNVFTGRPRTKEEIKKIRDKYPDGKFPDYVLYSSESLKPLAIIEAKRQGQKLEKALTRKIHEKSLK